MLFFVRLYRILFGLCCVLFATKTKLDSLADGLASLAHHIIEVANKVLMQSNVGNEIIEGEMAVGRVEYQPSTLI